MPPRIGKAAKKVVEKAVEELFQRLRVRLLGPGSVGKSIAVSYKHIYSLPGLYESATTAAGIQPDKATLDAVLSVAGKYIDAAEVRAMAQVEQAVNAFVQNATMSGKRVSAEEILGAQLGEIFEKVTTHVNQLVEVELNTVKNTASLEGVLRISQAYTIDDPTVFFVVVNDDSLCGECKRLHLMPDGITPRLWLLSNVTSGYHKRGDNQPCANGEHPNCFVESTRLHTSLGILTAKELFAADQAIGVAVDGRIQLRKEGGNQYGRELPGTARLDRHGSGSNLLPASRVYDTGVQDCVRVSLDTGLALEVSVGHDFWIDDDAGGAKKKAIELTVGDKVPLLSGEGAWGCDTFIEMAELMGNLMGDGCLGSTASWHFFGDDLPYGEYLYQLSKKFAGTVRDKSLTINEPNDKYSVRHATFNSVALRNIFVEEFGLTKKPRRVPSRLWSADKATVAAFLRGLYSADGHSEDTPAVVLAQNDREFLAEIQLLLANFGIRSAIYKHGDAVTYKYITYANGSVHTTKRKPCWRLHIGGWEQVKQFHDEIGFGVPYKQERLWLRLAETVSRTRLGAWRTARIVSVEPIGAHQTYCLTEPKLNTVTANGIVVGQCRCSLETLLPGYGFVGGRVSYISPGFNAYADQNGLSTAE